MTTTAEGTAARNRRFGLLVLAALVVAVTHRTIAILAAEPIGAAGHGYGDAELLTPGGDPALQFVLDRQDELTKALATAGLVLVAGRFLCFLAAFLLWIAAFRLALSEREQQGDRPRLHLVWALGLSLLMSTASTMLLAACGWALLRFARTLRHLFGSADPAYLVAAALALCCVWVVVEVWLELVRLCLAGGRLRPLSALERASQAWRRHLLGLSSARVGLVAVVAAASLAAILLLPVVTGSSAAERLWATLAIDLGLFGTICVRGAWLTWASAHVRLELGASPTPATFEGAAPSAEPDAPVDPSPDPGASPA